MYPYLYNTQGEWIGWVTPQREVYSILGVFVGRLSNDPRILGKRVEEYTHPKKMPPFVPERIYPPATVPLAPLMPNYPMIQWIFFMRNQNYCILLMLEIYGRI